MVVTGSGGRPLACAGGMDGRPLAMRARPLHGPPQPVRVPPSGTAMLSGLSRSRRSIALLPPPASHTLSPQSYFAFNPYTPPPPPTPPHPRHLGLGSYGEWEEAKRLEWLTAELRGKRPLIPPSMPFSADAKEVMDTLK